MKIQEVYLSVRPPQGVMDDIIEKIVHMINNEPLIDCQPIGVGVDFSGAPCVFVKFNVPRSNHNPAAVASLRFIHVLQREFFDHFLAYCPHPAAEDLTGVNQEIMDLLRTPEQRGASKTPDTTAISVTAPLPSAPAGSTTPVQDALFTLEGEIVYA